MKVSPLLGGLALLSRIPISTAQTLNIVAHEDDDLLFMSPDVLHEVQSGRAVRTVFLTAGDAGDISTGYWEQRQAGSQAAYAQMAAVDDAWIQTDAGIAGKNIPLFTLRDKPEISLAFLQLPDGNLNGDGFSTTGQVSLQKLWKREINRIQAVNGSSSYTYEELLNTLVDFMHDFQPDRVNTLDYVNQYGDGDHSDHHTAAYFVQIASGRCAVTHSLTGYTGYPIQKMDEDVFGDDLKAKQNVFFTYAAHDSKVCHDLEGCGDGNEAQWLKRQYTVTDEPVANAHEIGDRRVVGLMETVVLDGTKSRAPHGAALTYQWTQIEGATVKLSNSSVPQPSFATMPAPDVVVFQLVVSAGGRSSTPARVTMITTGLKNVARDVMVTASSHNVNTGQTVDKALDGRIDGYPGNTTGEWATDGGKAGTTFTLIWANPQLISEVFLYDRPNLNDQVTGGSLEFDGGSKFDFGALDNYGNLNRISFGRRVASNLTLTITSVSPSTDNVGLAEIEVYGTPV
ncbi:GlcNAc-PI de-N-acetylase-domain-containing protein [Aspergillus avenaceus]|uniref:N-acetylglucosaminylphosphatidylinositol deacetylase n=1 Tax=Aspergillus avenaceus TaxID=36643 RepID=A0A5N6U8B9_ASPAV|nr:GlcNAc-PI de-N-acetylase-domain-containing protein [Aspergillus avenaceus]